MTPELHVAQKQTSGLHPGLRRVIRLLQTPSLELHQELNKLIETHVLLELACDEDNIDQVAEYLPGRHMSGGDIADSLSVAETLHDYLTWQVDILSLSEPDRLIAAAVIDAINDKGYLQTTTEELADTVLGNRLAVSAVVEVLQKIQTLEPAGIAARTPQECLLLQLKRISLPPLVRRYSQYILEVHYEDIAHGDPWLLKKTKLSADTLNASMKVIRSLNPYPGLQIGQTDTPVCIPDLFVDKREDRWHVHLNNLLSPRLVVNSTYIQVIERLKYAKPSQGSRIKYWNQQVRDACFLAKGLDTRYSTMLQIMRCIVEEQPLFFERGEEFMKPFSMQYLATKLGLHESTISRAVQNKYVQTPRGIFAMNYFFSGKTCNSDLSVLALKAIIRRLIENEAEKKPLSDTEICNTLHAQQICIARRTVAKYRKDLGYRPAKQRRVSRKIC